MPPHFPSRNEKALENLIRPYLGRVSRHVVQSPRKLRLVRRLALGLGWGCRCSARHPGNMPPLLNWRTYILGRFRVGFKGYGTPGLTKTASASTMKSELPVLQLALQLLDILHRIRIRLLLQGTRRNLGPGSTSGGTPPSTTPRKRSTRSLFSQAGLWLYWGYIGIIKKKIETTIMGCSTLG